MGKSLFEIREENLETGLRGYPIGYCTTSTVDPIKGLFYQGLPVSQMADWEPLEVVFLLYHGFRPSESELKHFQEKITSRARISKKFSSYLRSLPKEAHPMQLLCAALNVASPFEGSGDYREDALRVVAKIPVIVATLINHHAGWEAVDPNPELGYMEHFTHLLNVPGCDPKSLNKIFRVFNILHYDHGGGNLSAFVGKAVASGLQDMWGSLAASMSALSGSRHGKANQDCLDFVKLILNELGPEATEGEVETLLRERLARHELIYGFGHAVLRVEDPRASIFYRIGLKEYPQEPLVKIVTLLRSVGQRVLKENPKISDPYPNVDAVSGAILSVAGFPYPQYFTVLFGLSRVIGVARQIMYERLEARDGKGLPIIRPKYYFKMFHKQ